MIACTGFGVRSLFGVSVNVSFWTLVAACGCDVVVGVSRLFRPLCLGVHHREKLTCLVVVAVAVAVVSSIFLLLLFIIDCDGSNVLSILCLAAFVCTYSSELLAHIKGMTEILHHIFLFFVNRVAVHVKSKL